MKLLSARLLIVSVFATLAAGCSSLLPKAAPPPAFYSLDGAVRLPATLPSLGAGPTLVVSPPQAAAGFDSNRMIYLRQAHHLEYFAHSEWVDTPARMAGPLMVAALQRSPALRAVLLAPGSAAADLRLDTQILRMQHDFTSTPSRVRLTLRATLVDSATRRVLAWREFDHVALAASEDAYGGVLAAHAAWQAVLATLVVFSDDAARLWAPPPVPPPRP